MTGRPVQSAMLQQRQRGTYDLVEPFRGTQTGRPSANDEDVN